MEDIESKLGSQIHGPGQWIGRSLVKQLQEVAACFAQGDPSYERVHLRGYAKPIWRCTRCLKLRITHVKCMNLLEKQKSG